ncbi:MAG: hypothetical protein KIT34_10615 [Cyanobacteria bacterium TGS_CYA1]|nr:hypothetical protein [Cyanobacteria bacterium TGS_CYA1]
MKSGFTTRLIASKHVSVENAQPIVKFIRPAAKNYPADGWDRYLYVNDKPTFYLGVVCETCDFMFRRIPADFSKIDARAISDHLNRGLLEIGETEIYAVTKLIPSGNYRALLLELYPALIQPGTDDDHFAHKSYDDWGDEEFGARPIEHYQTEIIKVDESKSIFEFVVPMFDRTKLDNLRVEYYRNKIRDGEKPTALAVSILDTKWRYDFDDYDDLVEYPFCCAHFLLDGHHKIYAASLERSPITLLTFLSEVESIAIDESFTTLIENYA